MPQIDRIFQKNKNFVFRQIDDEAILVPIKNNVGDMGTIYNLNELGAYVWEHIDGEKKLADIKNLVEEQFEVSSQDAEGDLMEFVGELEQIDAVHAVE